MLAAALNTSPVALVFPDPGADDIEMLPGYPTRTRLAVQWFSGLLGSPPKMVASWQEAETETGTVRAPVFADAGDPDDMTQPATVADHADAMGTGPPQARPDETGDGCGGEGREQGATTRTVRHDR